MHGQGTIVLLEVIYVIRDPGCPCHPNPEEAPSPREIGYVDVPNQDTSSGSYQPPEP